MRSTWIAVVTFACLMVIIFALQYRGAHPRVPPPLLAKGCVASIDETKLDRFVRKGGRTTRYVTVNREGSSLSLEGIAEGRDLRHYDRLDLIDPVPRPVVQEYARAPLLAQARTFVWEHWRDRRPAYLILTLSSVDATSTSHIFVEPEDGGRWRVYQRVVHYREVDDMPTAFDVRWVIPKGYDKPGIPLGVTESPNPLKHQLEFRDACREWDSGL